jgi:hypothetical protein
MMHMILWRRLDLPGHEWSQLRLTAKGPELTGTAVFAHEDQPCRLSYSVRCDPAWITRSAVVRGSISDIMVDVHVRRDSDGLWTINDNPAPGVLGALDVDLAFSPSTNTLPIRRLEPPTGASAEVRAAWLTFPDFTLEPLVQRYTRIDAQHWRYESHGGSFVRELTVNSEGVVTDYPGLWRREA